MPQRSHHQSQDYHEGAEVYDRFGVTTVEERSGENGDAAGKERLDGANPGHGAVIAARKKGGCVICLKDTEGVQQTPDTWLAQPSS